jgi:hypothetical protein
MLFVILVISVFVEIFDLCFTVIINLLTLVIYMNDLDFNNLNVFGKLLLEIGSSCEVVTYYFCYKYFFVGYILHWI